MIVRVPGLLSGAELGWLAERLQHAAWEDGSSTAGYQSVEVKSNQQLPQTDALARESSGLVLGALERSPLFVSAALPRHVFPPLFNRYEAGMAFGNHVDNAVRQVPGTHYRMRTDLSATVFLSNPESYDGGDLRIEDTYGTHSVKLAAGDLVLYPAGSLHRVEPVTRGVRVAAFFWIQSMVRDDGQRTLLYQMDTAIQSLTQSGAERDGIVQLTACYHNLLRHWAEV